METQSFSMILFSACRGCQACSNYIRMEHQALGACAIIFAMTMMMMMMIFLLVGIEYGSGSEQKVIFVSKLEKSNTRGSP